MKTAVEWFIEKITLKKTETDIYLYPRISFEDVLKAKEMEKEQTITAYKLGLNTGLELQNEIITFEK
jgi:hypothetical protein